MTKAAITIIGLGPGSIKDLTLQAREMLTQAAHDQKIVYFRTIIHPTIDILKQDIPDLQIESFDRLYDESQDWSTLYQQIAEEVCNLAASQPILYVVPGHPLIGETSVQLVLHMARERNLSTTIVAGLSFIEPVCTVLELDPFESGTQIIDATNLASLTIHEVSGKIVPTVPLLVVQLYNRRVASQVKLALGECYPDEWPVKLVCAAGIDQDEQIIEMPLYELDRNTFANHLSTLYVPPVDEVSAHRLAETLRYIIMRLRRDPDGCPWDRQQTHQSLTRYLLEETYEVVEALEEQDMHKLAEELGDVLLQIYLHAEIARQEEVFSIGDVFEQINTKLIRRHPHVFGDVEVSGAGQVVQNWEAIKKQERAQIGKASEQESMLDHIPLASPALTISQEYQKRVRKVGFEHSNVQGVHAKLAEELQEVHQATMPEEQSEEIGDLLFVIAHWALWLNIDAEEALRRANRKFRHRFQTMEEIAHQQGRELTSYSPEEWEALWQRAKVAQKSSLNQGNHI
jgi:tetrapyrrole methylase family protein / MazG family protein